jgi:hypothetical protein
MRVPLHIIVLREIKVLSQTDSSLFGSFSKERNWLRQEEEVALPSLFVLLKTCSHHHFFSKLDIRTTNVMG